MSVLRIAILQIRSKQPRCHAVELEAGRRSLRRSIRSTAGRNQLRDARPLERNRSSRRFARP